MSFPDPEAPEIALCMTDVKVGSMRDSSTVVAEGVDWTVKTGEFWIIGGLQGSGKTDFLAMAAGLMAPLAGTYKFFGKSMPIFEESRLKHRLRLGLLFEEGRLLHHLTVRQNVALPLRYHRNLTSEQADQEIAPLMDRLELGSWANSTPGALSRNWRKRAALARALTLRPEVLFIDNPLGGLDLPHVRWWLELLDELAAGRGSVDLPPMTLIVTVADFRPWRGHARQFALLKGRRFQVLGDWSSAATATDDLVRELMMADPNGVVDPNP